MDDEGLKPSAELCGFSGPEDEELVLVVARTGRSVAVRHNRSKGAHKSVARIWHPLSADPRVEIEDRWRARSTGWKASLKSLSLRALREALPRSADQMAVDDIKLEPSSLLGTFAGPGERSRICMMVARTGRSVAARLGDKSGQIIARARRPTCVDPGIVFEGLYRQNPADWQREFKELFSDALKRAVQVEAKDRSAVQQVSV